jgi:uncharacterized lipoprotein YajG
MKHAVIATALAILAGCASQPESNGSSGATASEDTIPLYEQNPANCAELSAWACRRFR